MVVKSTTLFAYEALIEFVSLLVTFAIGYYSYKIYKYSSDKKYWYFTMSFLFISLGFLIRAITNAEVYFGRVGKVPILDLQLTSGLLTAAKAGYITQLFLMLAGYMILVILSLKFEDHKSSPLLLYLTAISAILGYKWVIAFHITSFVLLWYIAYHFYLNYTAKKSLPKALIFTSFLFILLSQVFFIVVLFFKEVYFTGNVLQLIGYLTLLASLLLVLKK